MNDYNYDAMREQADAFEQVVAAAVLLREARRDSGLAERREPISLTIANRFMHKALDDYTTLVETRNSRRRGVSA